MLSFKTGALQIYIIWFDSHPWYSVPYILLAAAAKLFLPRPYCNLQEPSSSKWAFFNFSEMRYGPKDLQNTEVMQRPFTVTGYEE